jgi:hypothetical protein
MRCAGFDLDVGYAGGWKPTQSPLYKAILQDWQGLSCHDFC